MKSYRGIAFAMAGLSLPLASLQAHAAEMKVLASTAVKSVLEQVSPLFEKATGNKPVFSFGPAAVLKGEIDKGATFDVAILTAPLTGALVKSGKIDAATSATIARAGLGVAVRAGAAKPDVSTDAALKAALLNARSIGYNGVGASRGGSETMINKLGIADALKSKIKLLDVSAPVAVAKGEVDMGLGPISEVLPVAGAQLAGPFPADLQSYLVFAAGASSVSKNAGASKLLIEYLASPAVAPVLKSKGMEPG
jgi:molybdate transport system substrate-binding protein